MTLLTWNLERPLKPNQSILDALAAYNADIIILTETNSCINLSLSYSAVATTPLSKGHDGVDYTAGENRTTIWSKYPITAQYTTYYNFTSVCAQIETPYGALIVYGTIIGVFGGIGERFKAELGQQMSDFEKLSSNNAFCIAGDLNVTFSGRAYPSYEARTKLTASFEKLNLVNLTACIEDNVDHIVVSKSFVENWSISIESWNHDKRLSDHIGVCVQLSL